MGLYIVAVYMVADAEMPPKYKEFYGLEDAKAYCEEMRKNRYVADVRIFVRTHL